MTEESPYSRSAEALRGMGYHPLPCMPGSKVPGELSSAGWSPMRQWSRWCEAMPPEFLHAKWTEWGGAGVCMAHGAVVGLDIDTDRKDVAEAAVAAVGPSPVRRVGSKGWMGYYRPGAGLAAETARVRWYDADGVICVELLLSGTQSVLPPTIHPGTGMPYRWITYDTLEATGIRDLPELPADALARLDAELGRVGLTRKAPKRVHAPDYDRPAPASHDLEKPFGRSLNDRAMEPEALDRWWPALDLPKSRQRGRSGSWEAVPFWRASNSGRAPSDRNPNLKSVPSGIVDFGADRSYTPIDLVMAARDCGFQSAVDWLEGFVRPEDTAEHCISAPERPSAPAPVAAPPEREDGGHAAVMAGRWAPVPVFGGRRSSGPVRPIAMPTEAEFHEAFPPEPPGFPIGDFGDIPGLLGEVVRHIDAAAAVHTEAGAIAVSLPLLGAAMGQGYATPTNLRTNVYTVALGGSGQGKTALVLPAKELMRLAQADGLIGSDRFASGPGILEMLTVGPRRVCFLDEFGHMLQQMGAPGAGVHARQVITEFTALYSAANTLFTGTARASREPTPIDCPHLCLFGMATPDQFWRAFGSSALEDGSVARYLVFPIGATADKDIDASGAQEVASMLVDLQGAITSRIRGNMGRITPIVAPLSEDAETARAGLKVKERGFAEFAERTGVRGAPSIIRRVTENALKIALISAVGRDPRAPEISDLDFDIGHALAWWSASVMIANIASHIADNQIERDVNEVERKIREAGPRGIMKGALKDRCRGIGKRVFDEIIDGLEEAGKIERTRVQSHAKPGWKIVHVSPGDGA